MLTILALAAALVVIPAAFSLGRNLGFSEALDIVSTSPV
jgi:hypothetical protein